MKDMDLLNKNITIDEVAKAAGVSVSTVSRALNDKPDVAESTKERIKAAMKNLGYRPHRFASNLAGGLSRTVALLLPIREGGLRQLILDFIVGASRALDERDFILTVVTEEINDSALRSLQYRSQVDGVILMRTQFSDPRVTVLQDIGLPFVMLGRCSENFGLSYVDLDFEQALSKSLFYLYQLGHRNIGFITYSQDVYDMNYSYAHLTLNAFNQYADMFGLKTTVCHSEATSESVRRSTEYMLKSDPDITAVITVYAELAGSTENIIFNQGLSIPEDISLLAITEDKTAEHMAPALTSTTFPSEQMGYTAANLIVDRIIARKPDREPRQILLSPTLTERETTAKARSTN